MVVGGREPRDSVTRNIHGSSVMALQRKYSRVGVIMPPRIREMGIKCLTVTALQQHRAQSILEHLEGEDWMSELARLEAIIAVVLTLEFCHLSHSGYWYMHRLANVSLLSLIVIALRFQHFLVGITTGIGS
ncbi:hypothetical protein GmHk_19G053725 [Glycine max]|nr:hypothetical protein GmHk_19G053725 [Glycine max]